jgi:hypothetical protein
MSRQTKKVLSISNVAKNTTAAVDEPIRVLDGNSDTLRFLDESHDNLEDE